MATAQLISVLHKLPPPDTQIRRRQGYTEIGGDDGRHTSVESAAGPSTSVGPQDPHNDADRDVVQHDGWQSLTWSFMMSGLMTVPVNPS